MKLKRKNSIEFYICALYVTSVIGCFLFPGTVAAIVTLFILLLLAFLGYNASVRHNSDAVALFLALPVIMSAFQNIYLGMVAQQQTLLSIQILLSGHFFFVIVVNILKIHRISKMETSCMWIILLILLQSITLYIIYPSNITAAISSLRNILSCIVFYTFAKSISSGIDTKKFYRILDYIVWLVIAFGFFEYCVGLSVWKKLGITKLWELKRIATNIAGIPPNWYSSESIGGNIIRRMVSSFADPVNLGTYLFAAFMIAWYHKKKLLSIVLLICIVLSVSKGALLGLLIFLVIYTWFKDNIKVLLPVVSIVVLTIGLYFVEFSRISSSGSLFAHVSGFLGAFNVLRDNPFGLGVGNVGVLAGLFSSDLSNTSVSETGIGMIIAQLGIIGIVGYVAFFIHLYKEPQNWIKHNRKENRTRILYYTLLFAFIANAMFNEVALSPNSCGIYFIELAVINNQMTQLKKEG